MKKLSAKKQRFLDFIRESMAREGAAPTFARIMEGLNLRSLGTVNWYVRELEKSGHLRREGKNAKRAIVLTEESPYFELPLLGVVAAGYPLEAPENRESIQVPEMYARSENYVLRVRGESMLDDHIQDGDYVIVHDTRHAEDGQTVVAYVNNEATLKRFYRHSKGVELRPCNREFHSIFVNENDDFRIGGVALFVFRNL